MPSIYWKGYVKEEDFKKNCNSSVDGKWVVATLNAFIDEAINNISKQWQSTPAVKCLVLAGHSGAYRIFNPLANEFKSNPKTASGGKLAMLKEVWALEETYGTGSVEALQDWAKALAETCRFTAVLNNDVSNGWDCTQENKIKPFDCWNRFYPEPKRQQPLKNLKMISVDDSHCLIPQKWIETLLSRMPCC